MLLQLSDIEGRIITKLNKSMRGNASRGIIMYGEKNDYPETIERIVLGSVSAISAVGIYSSFLLGDGFEDTRLNNLEVGRDTFGHPITLYKLAGKIARSIAMFNGFYLHASFNAETEKVSKLKFIPYKFPRLGANDDNGYSGKIAYCSDWQNYKKEGIVWYNNFNINSFLSQIKEENESFRGQIYCGYMDSDYMYPLSPFDSVYLDADTEQQAQIFRNNQIRNGFAKKTVLSVIPPSDEDERELLINNFKQWSRPDGQNMLMIEGKINETTGEIDRNAAFAVNQLDSNIQDDTFADYEERTTKNIFKAARNIPIRLVDCNTGSLSNSAEATKEDITFYNLLTEKPRQEMAELIRNIMVHFDSDIITNETNFELKPLSYDSYIQPATGD